MEEEERMEFSSNPHSSQSPHSSHYSKTPSQRKPNIGYTTEETMVNHSSIKMSNAGRRVVGSSRSSRRSTSTSTVEDIESKSPEENPFNNGITGSTCDSSSGSTKGLSPSSISSPTIRPSSSSSNRRSTTAIEETKYVVDLVVKIQMRQDPRNSTIKDFESYHQFAQDIVKKSSRKSFPVNPQSSFSTSSPKEKESELNLGEDDEDDDEDKDKDKDYIDDKDDENNIKLESN